MRFSSRIDVSEPNPIILAQRKAIVNGVKLTKLNDSNPTSHGLAPKCLSGRYTADPRGPKEIRDILSNFINKRDNRTEKSVPSKLNPDQLYVLSSTSQAYAWLMMLLCDAGDAVMGPTPGYPLIESIARLQCVNAIPYPLHYDGSWTIDIARVRELLEDVSLRIKALVLINPNNPTGSYVKPEERGILLQLCRDNGVAIIADEVFYEYSL
ncbi:aminotransferase, partial [Bifidobacteriaceae bacterium WP022]